MSTLTEEQRRRMEENRRKALERRAVSYAASQVQNPVFGTKTVNGNSRPISNENQVPSSNTVLAIKHLIKDDSVARASSIVKNFYSDKSTESKRSKYLCQSDYVKGSCVLLSRQRFYVDVGYKKELIDVFKTLPSKLYDAQTKKWNFLISDHEKLMSLVRPLPNVLIVPLHRFIIKFFIKASPKRIIEEQDLSRLDPFLLKSLLPFQIEGVNFGIQHNGRVLIADDMGLGKTIQAIAISQYFCEDWPLLVVTPSSVRYSWLEAFHTWLPSLDRSEVSVINSSRDHISDSQVTLISYDLVARNVDDIMSRKFKSVIIDESHFLKNEKAGRTKACLAVIRKAKRVILLSGTPALSRPIELYTQVYAIQGLDFFSMHEYGIRYCNARRMNWGWDYSGSTNMGELQILLEEVVMIRRLKSEVIKQLPQKFREMVVLDPLRIGTQSAAMQDLFEKTKDPHMSGGQRRCALLEYFHETSTVKRNAVCEYVGDLLECGRKFLCFAHHQTMINAICLSIELRNVRYIRIDGKVSAEQRKRACDEFQMNDSCKVAVLSITAANYGITLTAASLVVFAELFWNPGILTQAEDRAHRIGQEDSVVVQYLVAKGTADDDIWPLVQRKLDILNKAGLSKDNFSDADTIVKDNSVQLRLEDFWGELDTSLKCNSMNDETIESREKRMKIEF